MIELIDLGDCLQVRDWNGWINVYPEGDVQVMPLPDIIPADKVEEARAILAKCKEFTKVLVSDAEAENAVFAQAVAANQAEEDAREDARAEATMIKRGRIPLPDDYREDPYLWDALARMGVVKSEAEEKAGE